MKKPFVVGIGGGTCSGKSTLTKTMEERLADLPMTVLHMDRYYLRPAPTTVAPITGKVYRELNTPEALNTEQMLADFQQACEDEGNALVIIEGLFALHLPEILERLDLKVFVDLKSDERIVRRIKRHMSHGEEMQEITDRYLDSVRYRHEEFVEPSRWRADVVFNGTLAGRETDIFEAYIRTCIAQK